MLREKLVSSFMAFEEKIDVQTDLSNDIRTAAIKNFENKGFPTKRGSLKYTSLNAILKMISAVFQIPKIRLNIEM